MKTKINGYEIEGSIDEIRQLISEQCSDEFKTVWHEKTVQLPFVKEEKLLILPKKKYRGIGNFREQIKEMLLEKKTYKQMARQLGYKYSSLCNFILRDNELNPLYAHKPSRLREVKEEVIKRKYIRKRYNIKMYKKEIKEMLEDGKKYTEISNKLNLPYKNLAKYIYTHPQLYKLFTHKTIKNKVRKVHNRNGNFNIIKGFVMKKLMSEGKTFKEAYNTFISDWKKNKSGGKINESK